MTMEKLTIATANKVNFLLPTVNTQRSPGRNETSNLPVYVKHGFPEVFKNKTDHFDYLPKLSHSPSKEAEENYGLMYHKPETDAEIKMHDLWVARRRQESSEWKSQQQLSLVLDRLSLHKSRLESDLLRRHESGVILRGEDMRPKSANGQPDMMQTNRFAPLSATSRCRSKLLSARSAARRSSAHPVLSTQTTSNADFESDCGPFKSGIYEDLGEDMEGEERCDNIGNGARVVVKVMKNGVETEQVLNQTIRRSVKKAGTMSVIPMRYKTPIPLSYLQEHYMELSDSDDGDLSPRSRMHAARLTVKTAPAQSTRPKMDTRQGGGFGMDTGQGGKKPKGFASTTGVKIQFKRDKVENRERPVSAALFRTLAETDPEFKVLYRYSNYRRMSLSGSQQAWLDSQEKGRNKFSQEYAKKLVDDQIAKVAKRKEKERGKEKKDEGKIKKKEYTSQKNKDSSKNPLKPKYLSAYDFMEKNFPNFDRDDSVDEDRDENLCPMRATQNHESDRVMGAFAKFNLPIKESVVRNALLVPQDYPEAICLEQLRTTSLEGLMMNPIKKELWRTFNRKVTKKGGKKKKVKK